MRALTNSSFFDRKDVSENASFSQPSLEEEISSREDNSELISEGIVFTQVMVDLL